MWRPFLRRWLGRAGTARQTPAPRPRIRLWDEIGRCPTARCYACGPVAPVSIRWGVTHAADRGARHGRGPRNGGGDADA